MYMQNMPLKEYKALVLTDKWQCVRFCTSCIKVYSAGALFVKVTYQQILQKNVKDECTSRWLHSARPEWLLFRCGSNHDM